MKKIPTAKEHYLSKIFPTSFVNKPDEVELWLETHPDAQQSIDIMIEFAKLNVEAALKEASEKAKTEEVWEGNTGSEYCYTVIDRDSILNSYSLENIK